MSFFDDVSINKVTSLDEPTEVCLRDKTAVEKNVKVVSVAVL